MDTALSDLDIQNIAEALLIAMQEAKGEYFYETILVKRSLTGDSDSGPCEECDANEAEGWIDSEAVYPSGDDGPPFHPNAVLAGSTFVPYGRLQRMVSAKYEDVAITLNAGEYRTTIGPNHPMLTARGLVCAKLLQVGDQLIYDRRAVKASGISDHSHLDKIPSVEDTFAAAVAVFGYSLIAASADDFHGDQIRQDHKVHVVLPQWDLLFKLDSCGVEGLRERGLMLPDMETKAVSAFSFTLQQLQAFFLTSTGGVSGSGVGVNGSRHFGLASIHSINVAQVNTRAFDASTEVGLYCSDGFVVSNCVCDEEYKEKRVRVYV